MLGATMITLARAVVAIALATSLSACTQETLRFEDAALADFVSEQWEPDLFDDECTGLKFDPSRPVLVFATSSGYSASLLDFTDLASVDLKSTIVAEGGLDSLAKQGISEERTAPVSLAPYPSLTPAVSPEPRDEWQREDGYLVRFSNRVRLQDRVFVQIWVKGSRTSSGARIDYEFDDSGKLIRSHRQKGRCDDWG